MNERSKALVTGVAGFIGSHVAEKLIALNFDVIGIDDLSGGVSKNVPNGVQFLRASITDMAFLKTLFEAHDFDYVYHIAAYAAEGLSHFIRHFNYQTNLIGSVNLINEAVKNEVKCFVFTSSIAVYGPGQTPMVEETTPIPEDPYGISKYAVELDLEAARRMFGLNYIIFRPHNVYGERQNISDRYRNVIGIFMNQVMQGKPMTIFGDGLQTRAFSHIDDVAPVIAQSVSVKEAYNQIFNIGADTPCTVLELAEQIALAFGIEPKVEYIEERKEVLHAFASHEKIRSVFNLPECISLEDGIQRMANWTRKAGPNDPINFDRIEIEKNLPPSWTKLETS